MSTEMHRFGTSEEDDEDTGMDVQEEDHDDDDDDEEKNNSTPLMVGVDGVLASSGNNNRIQQHQQFQEQTSSQAGSPRCRPIEEKERTKIRERQRRAVTAKILAGLPRHGNYNLRVRADINDVIAALAREAGWVVLRDGTTFPSVSQGTRPAGGTSTTPMTSTSAHVPMQQQTPPATLGGICSGYKSSMEYNACPTKGVFVPTSSLYDASSSARSHMSAMVGDGGAAEIHPLIGGSMDTVDSKKVIDVPQKLQERHFAGTPCVPVYVMLPLGVINMKCELNDPDALAKQLRVLKSVNVDGVMVDCWWGIVEAHAPQEYNWNGYKRLFQIVRELKLKLQVVMSFHACGGNVGDDVCIPLPHWVAEIGRSNPDIFFSDREGRRNPECLSWGIDKERVLRGRTAVEDYFDYMRSFRVEFDEFFEDGIISMIEVGLGPCGELRYPSNPVKHGWRYPGVGEFQCYDQILLKSLRKAAEARGHSFWTRGPDNAGSYNSRPHETGFFCDGGDYDGYYGRFFLSWYSQVLVDHGDRVLSLAKLAFEGTCIAAKLSGIHWWYKSASHAAELTAGYYNPCNRDGYAAVMAMLKKHGAAVNFMYAEWSVLDQHGDFSEALADPEGLAWQVLNAAWDVCIPVASENALPCHDREGYNNILERAKPLNDPDGRHFCAFTYLRLGPLLMETQNFVEFERFVKRIHGEAVLDLHS
uniref:Beta-amylase n=1 Tax=Camellia fraterna TaxID=542725 RepID=A0A4P9I8S0_9ERIC|nr:beta-amylase [Camellia fraterna]